MAEETNQLYRTSILICGDKSKHSAPIQPSSTNPADARSGILARITIEPAIFLYTFAFLMYIPVFGVRLRQKLCLQCLSFSADECRAFGSGKNLTVDTTVQKAWANFDNWAAICGTFPSMLVALSVGPWSDTFGRKLLLTAPFIGMMLTSACTMVLDYYQSLSVWTWLLPNTMLGLTGGLTALITGAYAYAADLSAKDNSRTIRNTIIEICATSGYSLAGILSGVLNGADVSASMFYIIAFSAAGSAFLYTVVFVSETRRPDQHYTRAEAFVRVFRIKHFVDSCKTVARKRAGRARLCLCLLMAAFAVYNVTLSGEEAINQKFFLASPLSWTLSYYMYFQAAWGFANMVIVLLFVLLTKEQLKLPDAALGMLGCVSRIGFDLVIAFASATWMAYMANAFGILKFMSAIAMRTLMSKLVSENEQGKLLSLLAAFEGASPLMGSVLITPVFTFSVDWWPGFYSLAGAATTVIPLALLVLAGCYVRMDGRRVTEEVSRRASVRTTTTETDQ